MGCHSSKNLNIKQRQQNAADTPSPPSPHAVLSEHAAVALDPVTPRRRQSVFSDTHDEGGDEVAGEQLDSPMTPHGDDAAAATTFSAQQQQQQQEQREQQPPQSPLQVAAESSLPSGTPPSIALPHQPQAHSVDGDDDDSSSTSTEETVSVDNSLEFANADEGLDGGGGGAAQADAGAGAGADDVDVEGASTPHIAVTPLHQPLQQQQQQQKEPQTQPRRGKYGVHGGLEGDSPTMGKKSNFWKMSSSSSGSSDHSNPSASSLPTSPNSENEQRDGPFSPAPPPGLRSVTSVFKDDSDSKDSFKSNSSNNSSPGSSSRRAPVLASRSRSDPALTTYGFDTPRSSGVLGLNEIK